MDHSRSFRIVCFTTVALAASLISVAAPAPNRGTENDVTVAALDQPIPADGAKREKFLWNAFSRRPEIDWFRHHTTQNWRTAYDQFSAALVAKAREQGREWQVLKKCLDKVPSLRIEAGRTAYLPIGAYRASQGKMQVWVIFCLWEMEVEPAQFAPPLQADVPAAKSDGASAKPVMPQFLNLGHFRVFTFDLEAGDLAGFVTCG